MTKQILLIVTTIVVILGLIGLVSARRHLNPVKLKTVVKSGNEKVPPGPDLTLVQQQKKKAQLEAEIITITPHGFEPSEITRPAGSFVLFIEDRSGFEQVSPQLTRLAGLRVFNLRIPREQPDWSDVVNLQPGVYLLTDSDHPTWSCRVTINP